VTNPITHESMPHENAAGELIRVLDAVLAQKFGRRMVVGLFVADFYAGGYLGWSSNSPREDMAALLVEWLGTNTPEILQQAVERWQALQLLGAGAERTQ
jgi:hypothetical protein